MRLRASLSRPLESRLSPAPKAGYGAGLQIRCLVLMRSGIAANLQVNQSSTTTCRRPERYQHIRTVLESRFRLFALAIRMSWTSLGCMRLIRVRRAMPQLM